MVEQVLQVVAQSYQQVQTIAAFPLLIAGVFVLIVVALGVYVAIVARVRADARVAHLVKAYDTVTKELREAQKIGHFGSFVFDFRDLELSSWSEEMYRLYGLMPREKTPDIHTFLRLAHPQDESVVREMWTHVCTTPGPFAFSYRIVLPTKQVRYVHVEGNTLMDVETKQLRIEGVVHDITKEMEIDRAKSEFVSLASHQLKTPITSIKWLSEVLLRKGSEPVTQVQEKYISNIHDSSQHMIEMINDLLNVSRIELGTLSMKIDEFDVKELIENIREEQWHAAEEKHLTLNITYDDGLPHLVADRNLFRMVIQNLISNAIRYTPANGTIECAASRAQPDKEFLFVRVTDSGIGIPKEERKHIFEKLYRAPNAQTLVPDGTGLGLYVVKTVIERAHGGISFESEEGKGTTFYVSVPFVWHDTAGVEKAHS